MVAPRALALGSYSGRERMTMLASTCRRAGAWFRARGTFVMLTGFGGLLVLAVASGAEARNDLTLAGRELDTAREALLGRDDDAAAAALARADARVRSAGRAARSFPLGALRPVPLLGSPTRALHAASKASSDLVAAGRVILKASRSFPTSGATGLDAEDLSALHQAARRSVVALSEARQHVSGARRAIAGPSSAVVPLVSAPALKVRGQIDAAIRQIDGARRALKVTAALTAPTADLRILVLAQDSLELRPTGGYVGSYGVLRFARGTVELERYEETAALPPPEPPMSPPEELAPVLPRHWGLSNVNWWPDFPTTAATAKEMFGRQGGGQVDGVLALTEHATALLVGAVGPIDVPGHPPPVVEEGFDQRVLYEVELKRPLDQPRKKFLTALAKALFERLSHLPAKRVPGLIRAVDVSARAGDVQVWFADHALQRYVERTIAGGRLPDAAGDFLMLVDANLTASKANAALFKDVTYRVARARSGELRARLDVTVRNEGELTDINPYYNGYLRVYVPLESRLLERRSGQGDAGRARDGPYTVFTQILDVQPRGEQRMRFDYVLPERVAPDGHYRLTWVRQAGTPRDHLSAVVGGSAWKMAPGERSVRIERDLSGHGIVEWLRRRWVVRQLLG